MNRPGIEHHGDYNEDHRLQPGLPADEGIIRLEEAQKDGPSSVSGEGYSSRTCRSVVKNVPQGLKISDRTRADEGCLMGFDRLDEPAKEPTTCEYKELGNYNKIVNGSEQVHHQISKTCGGSSQLNADVSTEAVLGGVSISALELLADTASRTAWLPLARSASPPEEKAFRGEHQHEEP